MMHNNIAGNLCMAADISETPLEFYFHKRKKPPGYLVADG